MQRSGVQSAPSHVMRTNLNDTREKRERQGSVARKLADATIWLGLMVDAHEDTKVEPCELPVNVCGSLIWT